MATVRVTASDTDQLSEESLARLAALKDRLIDYSDIPEDTPEQLAKMRQAAIEYRKKQMFSLRLQNGTLNWWKSLGGGYTTIMARLLEEARHHPEWIQKCL
jgi:uncharacterized protein (DUF4415 family)